MTPKIIVTGFEAFHGVPVNPTESAIKFLLDQPDLPDGVIARVLPVTYQDAGAIITDLIREHRPDAVLMFGVAAGRDAITPEQIAVNINDASRPDNNGVYTESQPIVKDGEPYYKTTLPFEDFIAALQEAGIPAKPSSDAGTYVCNHVFYTARHIIAELGLKTWAGFVHVPMHSDDPSLAGADTGLPLWMIQQAMLACVLALDSRLRSDIMTDA